MNTAKVPYSGKDDDRDEDCLSFSVDDPYVVLTRRKAAGVDSQPVEIVRVPTGEREPSTSFDRASTSSSFCKIGLCHTDPRPTECLTVLSRKVEPDLKTRSGTGLRRRKFSVKSELF
jgi:hypothetical protein